MAWWDDVAEAAGSALGVVGDAVEAVVDTVVEVVEEVAETATELAIEGLDALRDGAAAVSPALGAIANVALGIVKGGVQAVQDGLTIAFDVVRNLGALVSDVFHLDPAGFLGDLAELGINVGLAVAWGLRVVTGGPFGGAVSGYFMRDRAVTFIQTLIVSEFGKKDGEAILRKLGRGTVQFALPIKSSARIMRADSDSFPFVDLHKAGKIDLYSMAGVLSFNSFKVNRERTRVVQVDENGNDMWWMPMTRWTIRSFLDSEGTSVRIRAYAMESTAAGKAMRTARKKFKRLCIDLRWDTPFNFSTFQQFTIQPCATEQEFAFFSGGTIEDARWFAQNTPRDGGLHQDGTPLAIGIFGYESGQNGLVTGRDIKRGRECSANDTSDACVTKITRSARDFGSLDSDGDGMDDLPDAPCGCGCTWRDTYPPYFGRLVLTHELGHYFGLAHAGHDGVDKIMISTSDRSTIFAGDTFWRWWLQGDAEFVEVDVEDAWRFIVKEMPHVLRAL